jgi:hypothetical protein
VDYREPPEGQAALFLVHISFVFPQRFFQSELAPVSTHLYPEVTAHVVRVTETAHWLEWQDWAGPPQSNA